MARSEKPCAFCQIVTGAAAALIVYEDANTLAFFDRRPVFKGHCLLIPRAHWPTIQQLPSDMVEPLFSVAQHLSIAVEHGLKADGVFVGINNGVSQSVPHLHIHVIPRRTKDGLRGFFWPRERYESDREMEETAVAIRQAM